MRAFLLSLCAGLVTALALPAAASALIQIDRGIAGARLSNTVAQVHAALGKPAKKKTGTNDFGTFLQETYAGGIVVLYQGGTRVTSVSTTGLGDRTTRGVGVGSSEHSVRMKVPHVHCETVAGIRSCHTHAFTVGQRVTDFLIRHGKVVRVSVGFVLD